MINSERFKTLTQSFIDGGIDDADAVELLQAIQESNNLRDQLRAQVAMHAVIERRYRKRSSAVNRRVHAALRDPSQKKGAITRIMDKLDPKAPKKKGGLRTPVQAPPPQPAPSRAWRPSRRFVAMMFCQLGLP